MKEKEFKTGDKVLVVGTDWMGTVTDVSPDGTVKVRLSDNSFFITPPSGVTPLDASKNQPQGRSADGRFTPGNSVARRKKSAHYYQSLIRTQVEPFLCELGVLINQIDDPYAKVMALSHMLPYGMPKLSQMEYNETTKRNFTAEEQIAKLNAEYHHKPDPTATDDEDEDA